MNVNSLQRCYYIPVTESTQTIAKTYLNTISSAHLPFAVCAGYQVAGRGKGERAWVGIAGNIAFSMVIPLASKQTIGAITCTAGVALCRMLRQLMPAEQQQDIRVKWPNDIYNNNRKLAGILTEMIPVSAAYNHTGFDVAIIGIGVNTVTKPLSVKNSGSLNTPSLPKSAGFADLFAPFFLETQEYSHETLNKLWQDISYPRDGQIMYDGHERYLGAIHAGGALLLLDKDGKAAETITDSDALCFPSIVGIG